MVLMLHDDEAQANFDGAKRVPKTPNYPSVPFARWISREREESGVELMSGNRRKEAENEIIELKHWTFNDCFV